MRSIKVIQDTSMLPTNKMLLVEIRSRHPWLHIVRSKVYRIMYIPAKFEFESMGAMRNHGN